MGRLARKEDAGMSAIEWTQQTWNPVTGCDKVSPGCAHCYAETMARRLASIPGSGYDNGFSVSTHYDRLRLPHKHKRPTMFFVCSMSDLFHEDVSFFFIDAVMRTIAETPRHTYQILTKRPARMVDYFDLRQAPDNVWLGVSVENKKHGVPRIDKLRRAAACNAAQPIRFLSCEPLLEDLGKLNLEKIGWVIVGGESGARARPMAPEWAHNIRKQCNAAKVDFFFKQWGRWGEDGIARGKKKNGRTLGGWIYDTIPIHNDAHDSMKLIDPARADINPAAISYGNGNDTGRIYYNGKFIGFHEQFAVMDAKSKTPGAPVFRAIIARAFRVAIVPAGVGEDGLKTRLAQEYQKAEQRKPGDPFPRTAISFINRHFHHSHSAIESAWRNG